MAEHTHPKGPCTIDAETLQTPAAQAEALFSPIAQAKAILALVAPAALDHTDAIDGAARLLTFAEQELHRLAERLVALPAEANHG